MATFEEAKKVPLTEEQKRDLERLGGMKEYETLKKVVEGYALQLTHNLIIGTEAEKGTRHEELDRVSGFAYYWSKVKKIIEKQKEDESQL